MERATVESLTAERLQTEEFEIPGMGSVVIRALSRWEMLTASKAADKGPIYMEREMIAYAMVDPPMTVDVVAAWQKASPAAELMPLVRRINELSGIGKGAEKSGVPEV